MKLTILTKSYAFFVALVTIYAVYLLKTNVLFGVADTAPFSAWSFIDYLLSFLPLLAALLLLYVARLFSPHEIDVRKVTVAMPFFGPLYFFIKISVIMIACIIEILLIITACSIFYGLVFSFFDLQQLIFYTSLILIAPLFFILGLGLLMCKINHHLAYVLLAIVFFLSFLRFSPSYFFDIFGYSLMQIPNQAIPIGGIISFVVPIGFGVTRVIFFILGLFMILISCLKYKLPQKDPLIFK